MIWSPACVKTRKRQKEGNRFMNIQRPIAAALLACLLCSTTALAAGPADTRREAPMKLSDPPIEDADTVVWEADPDGSVLTPEGGVNYYFDQKETYYNLNMDTVVAIAHDQGIEGEYWIRDDGCKMLGDYIMIAANRNVHPQGSIVPTSLGLGIVVDTGGFADWNATQVDIAVNW